jgi:hypothetical protein
MCEFEKKRFAHCAKIWMRIENKIEHNGIEEDKNGNMIEY